MLIIGKRSPAEKEGTENEKEEKEKEGSADEREGTENEREEKERGVSVVHSPIEEEKKRRQEYLTKNNLFVISRMCHSYMYIAKWYI